MNVLDILIQSVIIIAILRWVLGDLIKKKNSASEADAGTKPAAPDAAPVRVQIVQPRKTAERILKTCGDGGRVGDQLRSCSSTKIVWEDPATGEQRVPEDQTIELTTGSAFHAAGMPYAGLQQLGHQELGKDHWLDIHGREWINLYESYPCFDSSDYLYENRYYDWWFLQDGDRITRVFDNGSGRLMVTEDVGRIETQWLEQLQKDGYFLVPKPPNS